MNHYHHINKNIVCNNCGKYGHTQKQCNDPITSLGVICIKLNNKEIKNCIDEFIIKLNNEDLRKDIIELVDQVTNLNKKNNDQIRKFIYDLVNIFTNNNKKNYKQIKKYIIEITTQNNEKQIKKYIDELDKLLLINNSKKYIDDLINNILTINTKNKKEIDQLINNFKKKEISELIDIVCENNKKDNNQINKWIDELVHDEEFDINQNIIIDLVNNTPKSPINTLNNLEYLVIRRKHSLGYIEFIRGRYDINNIETINNLIHQITPDELSSIKTMEFKDIWEEVWKKTSYNKLYLKEMEDSMEKFNNLKANGYFDKELVNDFNEPEWGFPKGRRNPNEKNLKCALREFWEETGIVKSKLIVLNKLFPIQEVFYGTNNIMYKHVYYIAIYNSNDDIGINHLHEDQLTEIGDIKWKNLNECLSIFRPYHEEKKNVLYSLHTFLESK
jgi:8-oxo-dGTP pyrophosphatase MutT (NUDIX family)